MPNNNKFTKLVECVPELLESSGQLPLNFMFTQVFTVFSGEEEMEKLNHDVVEVEVFQTNRYALVGGLLKPICKIFNV
jgi:hypothetical protein